MSSARVGTGILVGLTEEEIERWTEAGADPETIKEIRQDAERIDSETAVMDWSYAQTLDPYGLTELPPECQQVGREYFLCHPGKVKVVHVDDVRAAHPEIAEEKWGEILGAAAKRDQTFDPFPMFHLYGQWKVAGQR